jgi:hypothetical protein
MEKFLDRFAKRVVNAEYVNNFLRERDSEHMHRTLYLRFDVKERVRKKPPINELKEHQAEAEKEAAAKEAHQQAVKEQVSYNSSVSVDTVLASQQEGIRSSPPTPPALTRDMPTAAYFLKSWY